ncbi:hypothetical protein Zm00014a_013003 [Zea mays]|uniref:Uncharacterized protein n=1 Tax=Zea mays TaxID=4577 RepID=A0A3L6DWI2_MAIZE|nr:hypothetical protein Zm00014a_013003 [Zea mays]
MGEVLTLKRLNKV